MRITEALIITKEIISNPKHWAQNNYSKPSKDGLRAYCSVGALNTLNLSFADYAAAKDYLDRVAIARGYSGIIGFNDSPGTTHAKILKLFDQAIALVKD